MSADGPVPRLRFPEFRDAGPWEVRRLGDLGPVSMCKRVMKDQTASTGDVPFYKIGTFGQQPDAYINRDLYEEFKSKYSFPQKGDILISAAGTIGRTVVYDGEPAYFQDSNIVWIANDEELATNQFLNFAYQKVNWRTDDNTIARLYNDNLRSIKVALPSPPEQQKIADCLSSLDDLIRAEGARLGALRDHKHALMQRLFPRPGETTPRLRFPEFRKAGPWEFKRLGEVCEINPTGADLPERFVYIDLESVEAGELVHRKIISREGAPSRAQRVLSPGDIVFQMVRPYQKNNLLFSLKDGEHYVASTGYAQLRAYGSAEFLYQLIHTDPYVAAVLEKCTGSNYPAINSSDLSEIHVHVPSLAEQQKIAECLTALDDLIRTQGARLEAHKAHKRGLMQQLFPQDIG